VDDQRLRAEIDRLAEEGRARLVDIRHRLHASPELSNREACTWRSASRTP
jgi:metal-dependent amidase/aminoacylase/carboxypeptidase family protein